jgi:hypothetical protein
LDVLLTDDGLDGPLTNGVAAPGRRLGSADEVAAISSADAWEAASPQPW